MPTILFNSACDKCGKTHEFVRYLTLSESIAGRSGIWLCRGCWGLEMSYRMERNASVSSYKPLYPIYSFDDNNYE